MNAIEMDTNVPVVMTSVKQTLTLKQESEINSLHNWLNDPKRLRDFRGFNHLVQDLQATIRAIDILDNSVLASAFESGRDEPETEDGDPSEPDAIPSFLTGRGPMPPATDENLDMPDLEGEDRVFPVLPTQRDE